MLFILHEEQLEITLARKCSHALITTFMSAEEFFHWLTIPLETETQFLSLGSEEDISSHCRAASLCRAKLTGRNNHPGKLRPVTVKDNIHSPSNIFYCDISMVVIF